MTSTCFFSQVSSTEATPNEIISILTTPFGNAPPTVGFSISQYRLDLPQGSTFSVAFIATKSVWLEGFTPADLAKGIGPQYGHASWQFPGTLEAAGRSSTFPSIIPSVAVATSLNMWVYGDAITPIS